MKFEQEVVTATRLKPGPASTNAARETFQRLLPTKVVIDSDALGTAYGVACPETFTLKYADYVFE